MVRILLREGQDINEQTQNLKNTPLHIAAQSGHLLIVKFLLESEAAVNLSNANALNPLELTAVAIELVTNQMFGKQRGSVEKQQAAQIEAAQLIANL